MEKFQLSPTHQIIPLKHNTVTNSQYNRREIIELNPVPTEIHEDTIILEDDS